MSLKLFNKSFIDRYPIVMKSPFVCEGYQIYKKIDIAQSSSNLIDASHAMELCAINYRVIFGTLLGIFRDNNLINHDTDIDLAIMEDDASKLLDLISILKNEGFYVIRYLPDSILSLGRGGDYVDIYIFRRGDDSHTLHCLEYSLCFDDFHCDNQLKFRGQSLPTISNPEDFFHKYYGSDWRTPVENLHASSENVSRNLIYWMNYYDQHSQPFEPSNFAHFVLSKIQNGESVIDLGCGNGRDSLFFAQNGHLTYGIDQCSNIINSLNSKEIALFKGICADFTNLNDKFKVCHAYSRFSLHSITENAEERLIKWVSSNITGMFFIESRSDQDSLNGQDLDHYRRFININKLLEKLIRSGFSILYSEISRGFSPYNSDFNVDYNEQDPMLIRVVCKNN